MEWIVAPLVLAITLSAVVASWQWLAHNAADKRLEALRKDSAEDKSTIAVLERDNEAAATAAQQREDELAAARGEITQLRGQLEQTRNKVTGLEAEMKANQQLARSEEERRKAASTQFENIANRILEQQSAKFGAASDKHLQQMLSPLKEQLTGFKTLVSDSFEKQGKDQSALQGMINVMVGAKDELVTTTTNLTRALRGDSKVQGDWGEFVLKDLLIQAGLREGRDFSMQQQFTDAEQGRRLRPDVVVNIPGNKHIIIDAKVSLTNYEQYVAHGNSDDAGEREHARQQMQLFVASVERHVKELARKSYPDALRHGSVADFTIMFMPIETAWSQLMHHKPSLFSEAWDKNIVILSPSNLFATLRVVAQSWRLEDQQRNAIEIAGQGAKLYDKLAGFYESMTSIGKGLDRARTEYDKAMGQLSSGRGNLVVHAQRLRELGVKTKKQLPADVIDEALSHEASNPPAAITSERINSTEE